jgi:hypothetical protein
MSLNLLDLNINAPNRGHNYERAVIMAEIKFKCSPLKVEEMRLNPDVTVRRVDDRKVELVDEDFATSTAGYSSVCHKEDGTITHIVTAWSEFNYALLDEEEAIWGYKGAINGFLTQYLIPLQLQDAEVISVEGSYGSLQGDGALEAYVKMKEQRTDAQEELDHVIGQTMGHDCFLPETTAAEAGHRYKIHPALLPQAVRDKYLEAGSTPEEMEYLEVILKETMDRLFPRGVPKLDVRELSIGTHNDLADELESWVKYHKPATEGNRIGYIAGTLVMLLARNKGVTYEFEFTHRKQYSERLQEWMARAYIHFKTPDHAFWKKAHKMVDRAEAKRRSHDMHNGLPDWAIPETHMRENLGPESCVMADYYADRPTMNKFVYWAGTEKYRGKKHHVYVYYYDNMWFGRFLAPCKPAPTKEEYEAAKEAETAVGS